MISSHDFRGTLSLVTGAASGIGYEIAATLAKAGSEVCILDIDASKSQSACASIETAGGKAGWLAHSVSSPEVITAIRDFAVSRGRQNIDFLVNAAAISPKNVNGLKCAAWEIPAQQWQEVMATNITGTFHAMSAVLPGMIRTGKGSIVNIGSLAGRRYSTIAGAAYATSKGAVEAMTRQFAGEVAEHGVRINAVSPGRIQTPMAAMAGVEFNEKIRQQTPLRRLGMPIDIANAVLFLLSDNAAFITGETMVVSGGRGL